MNSWQRERLRLSIGTVIPTEGSIDAPPTATIMEKFSENPKILTLLLGTDAQQLTLKRLSCGINYVGLNIINSHVGGWSMWK